MEEKERVEETTGVALGSLGVLIDLSEHVLIFLLGESVRRSTQDMKNYEGKHQKNREDEDGETRRDYIRS